MGFLHDIYEARGKVAPASRSPFFMSDKSAYVSPMDNTVVEGRVAHREHMRKHNVIEAGDMKIGELSRDRDNSPMPSAGKDIVRAIQELSSR